MANLFLHTKVINLKQIIYICLFAYVGSVNASYVSACNFQTSLYLKELASLNSVQSIEIDIKNYRKWTKNTLEAFVSRNSSITSEYKKKFSGVVKVYYSFGECIHNARIRLHGDLKDHINFVEGGKLNQSVDVSLLNGSIANIVKFKLLLPETRRYENEIILTSLLRVLGFIAPRTSLVEVNFNSVVSDMLFQEKASKELLENMNKREGPLFEGDERFLFNNFIIQTKETSHLDLENISLAKITNDNWASRNTINSLIALDSFSLLQKAYMTYGRDFYDNYILDWNILSNGNKKLIDQWATYEMLLFATNSFHALRPHNRKFYFNSFEVGFEPIYFDGNPRDINSKWLRYMPSFKDYSQLAESHFNILEDKISSINPEILRNEIQGNRFKLTLSESELIIQNTLEKVQRLRNSFQQNKLNSKNLKSENYKDISISENLYKNIKNSISKSYIAKIILDTIDFEKKFFQTSVCNINNNECIDHKLNFFDVGEFLERKNINTLKLDFPLFIEPPIIKKKKFINQSFNNSFINVVHSDGVLIDFNKKNSTLSLVINNENDWVLVKDSNLEDINVSINTSMELTQSLKSNSRINEFGLTGCLTFYNSFFKKTMIQANGKFSNCEDVVNIINSLGSIETLSINNASADGLDIDFSELEINNIFISNSQNDCVDFSKGKYLISSANLSNCGDKGISVGEQSHFEALNVKIFNANIGISSKDSSSSSIDFLNIDKVNICAEAFQKKQEFFGSELQIQSLVCKNKPLNHDANSSITLL